MTIAIGILADDGVVVAADSQETVQGYWKRSQHKIGGQSIASGDAGSQTRRGCLVSAAGRAGYCDNLTNHITDLLRTSKGKSDDAAAMTQKIADTVKAFHVDHVAPYSDHPDVSLIVGVDYEGSVELFGTDRGTVTAYPKFHAIGIGSAHALGLLGRLMSYSFPSSIDVVSAAILAAFVVKDTKRNVDGCGENTEIAWLYKGRFGSLDNRQTAELDDCFDEFAEIAQPTIIRMMCMRKKPADTNASRLVGQLRRRIHKTVVAHGSSPDDQ